VKFGIDEGMGSTVSTLLASSVIFLALPPGALATNGVDFSNNLFSDLGPVLALFGEQVTRQFMSQSMSWLEDVIFAMAPLGIITAIISAVRVGGPNWLKAVVGRARESEAVVEFELMSSTSHEVCELWNGKAIVRVMGSPDIAEILYFEDMANDKDKCGLFTLEAAIRAGLLRDAKETRKGGSTRAEENPPVTAINRGAPDTKKKVFSRIFSWISSKSSTTSWDSASADVENATSGPTARGSAPNISLNVGKTKGRGELWLFAILGLLLQFGSLIFIGITHYHPKINLKEGENSGYAYPLMASGTLFLVMGMMACSHVVQASSVEITWVAKKPFRILWLQKSATVNDQLFGSYALSLDGESNTLTTSRRKYPHSSKHPSSTKSTFAAALSFQNLTIVGSFISLAGFVTQFVGIRALHWSASIAQLVVTLVMTVARTWIRRNMSARPRAKILPTNYDINWLAVKFAISVEWLWNHGHGSPEGDPLRDLGWEVSILQGYRGYEHTQEAHTGPMTYAERVLKMREQLGLLTDWKGLSYPFALELVECLQSLLSCFVTSQAITLKDDFANSTVFRWALPVKIGQKREQITITATRSEGGGKWDISVSEICAIISLWSHRMKKYEQASDTPDEHGAPMVLRVLGPATNLLIRDCQWWMDGGGKFVVVSTSELQKNAESSSKVTTLETKELPKTIAQVGHSATKNSTASVAPHRIVGTKPIDCESLVFVSKTPLRRMCAQEILSSFMWAITGTVQSFAGKTEPRSATLPRDHEGKLDEWFDFKLESDFFQKLAETITESGVTGNNQDAYALIIPPFSAADKLPRVSCVIAETHRKLKNLQIAEKRENITKIRKTYLELFKICNSPRRTQITTITVTALLMEELCSLNNAVAVYTDRANFENEGEEISKSLDHIKNQLIKYGDKDTLEALICLYEKQGRDAGGMGQLPRDWATEVRATYGFKNLKKLEGIAGWDLAHELVTDDKDRTQEIIDMGSDRILKVSFDLNAVDILGWTPLHYVANKPGDRLSLAQSILDAGGQVDPRTKSDYTPLHYAAASGHAKVASRLYGKGAAKDARNIDLRTPLHLAAEQGHTVLTKFLLSKGADVKARDKYGWSPLHYAAAKGKKSVAEQLLAKGAMEDARENLEMTPLHMAASAGQLEIVRILLDRDPKAVPRDYIARTPLHLAALNGNGEVVEILITGTGPNAIDHEKNTPLHYAARRGNWDTANRLLHEGANPSPLNNIDSTPLHLACQNGHVEVVNELLSTGVNPSPLDHTSSTPLHFACQHGYIKVVNELLSAGADPNPLDQTGSTPLHLACQHGHIEIVNRLLLARANPTLKSPARCDQTPLEQLRANTGLPEDQRKELIALLGRYTKSWLKDLESKQGGLGSGLDDSGSDWAEDD